MDTAGGAAKVNAQQGEPLLLRDHEVAHLLGIGVRTWHSWNASGRTPMSLKVGRSRRWRAEELRQWVAAGCPPRREWMQRKK